MKRIHLLLPALATALFAAPSCEGDNEGPVNLPDAKAIVLKAEYGVKTAANRSFAIDLFKTTVAQSGGANIFLSPYSVNTALDMAWNGAAGATKDEMGVVLCNDGYTDEQINDYAKTLTEALIDADPTTDLRIANSIWADHATPFKPSFAQINKTWYSAEVKNVDFSAQATFNAIDKWCSDKTNGKIGKIAEGMKGSTLALINAVYFNGKWKYKFAKSDTRHETFTNSDGTKTQVDMMNQIEDLQYNDNDNWRMLKLPYGNKAYSMTLLMPNDDAALDDKLAALTADEFYDLLNNTIGCDVTVKLPKFKAEYQYDLHKQILPAMGMNLAFNPGLADFGAMSDTPVFIDKVIHKTFIDVYEEGTEAAAVTVVTGAMTSVGPGSKVSFYANRPFVYSIVENSTGTILFMGRINKF